jgi:hypothetical protein
VSAVLGDKPEWGGLIVAPGGQHLWGSRYLVAGAPAVPLLNLVRVTVGGTEG